MTQTPWPWWSRPVRIDVCSMVARMPRYAPAAAGICSAPRAASRARSCWKARRPPVSVKIPASMTSLTGSTRSAIGRRAIVAIWLRVNWRPSFHHADQVLLAQSGEKITNEERITPHAGQAPDKAKPHPASAHWTSSRHTTSGCRSAARSMRVWISARAPGDDLGAAHLVESGEVRVEVAGARSHASRAWARCPAAPGVAARRSGVAGPQLRGGPRRLAARGR